MSNVTVKSEDRIKSLINSDQVKSRFNEILGSRAPAFMSSVLSAVNSNPQLKNCEPMSVIQSAAIAASMDLPINSSLGFAHIVPYGDKAQFQMGWKGFVQLAMRTGQYKTIHTAPVYEGQIKSHNQFTGEMEFNFSVKSAKVEGYLLYFKLLNGFEKYFYMTEEEIESHGKRYSKSFAKGYGVWKENFEAMALKTVVKLGLSKFGVLSVDMQKAIESDQGTVSDDGLISYQDKQQETSQDQPSQKKRSSRMSKFMSQDEAPKSEPKDVTPKPEAEAPQVDMDIV